MKIYEALEARWVIVGGCEERQRRYQRHLHEQTSEHPSLLHYLKLHHHLQDRLQYPLKPLDDFQIMMGMG